MRATKPNMSIDPTTRRGVLFRTAVGSAVIAGAFSAIVAGVLWRNHLAAPEAGPLEADELTALAEQITARPAATDLRREYRRIDRQVRTEHFQRQRIAELEEEADGG